MDLLPESLLARFQPSTRGWILRAVAVLPATCVCLGLIFTRMYVATHGFHFEIFWPSMVGVALPIPLAYMLWLRVWDQNGTRMGEFSIPAAAAAIIIAIIAFEAITQPVLKEYRPHLALAATISALFIFTGYTEALRQLVRHPRASLLAALLGSTVLLHTFLHTKLWQLLCETSAWVIAAILKLLTVDVTLSYVLAMPVTPKPDQHPMPETEAVINIGTQHFAVQLYSGCSGMDGLMIFFSLMTIVTLIDWDRFRRFTLSRLYAAGLLTMYLVNALRISLLFLLGNISSHPSAPEWLKPMKDTMFTLFHEHIGWTIYVIVFTLFITPIYQRAWEMDEDAKEKEKS